ncbi:MAG: YggU family protein [Anaerolineae bacterium]|nr:MAG: YggU family protein [Anaerolineae bacterium]
MADKNRFKDGRKGSALPVRVTPRASRNEIVEILSDSTVKIRLTAPPVEGKANEELIVFLADVLGVPKSKLEIVAGSNGRDKLISILDMDSEEVHQKILEHLA